MASDLIERLRAFACAYPKDIFPPVSPIEAMQVSTIYPGLVDRCSAAMGRHFAPVFVECADALAAQAADIERLTKERDERNALAIRRAGEKATAEARADALAARVAELEERDKVLTGIMANVPDRMVLMGTGQVAERNSDGSVCVSNTQWLLGTVYELAGVLCRARAALQGAAPAGEGGGS